jgi:histone H3/H4
MELPIAPVGRIIKNAGAERVSSEAEEVLTKILEEKGRKIAFNAIELAKHSGRTTVKEKDMIISIENYHNCNINHVDRSTANITQKIEINNFNELYKKIDDEKNSSEIKQRVNVIEMELNNDQIDKLKIKSSMDWLKDNAIGIAAIVAPLISKAFGA